MDPFDFFSVLYDDLEDLRDLADGVLDIEAFDKTEVVFVEFDLPLSEENSELANLFNRRLVLSRTHLIKKLLPEPG